MVLALVIFLITYALMLALQKYRPVIALSSAVVFIALGLFGVYDFTPLDALGAVDYNVLMMIAGTMGIVSLFIESRMPAYLAEVLIVKVPNVKWAVTVLALFAGIVSAFVDNVATVLMVAPVGLAISKKLKISPVPVLIAIAVSSNLQGAATMVGDTTSMLLGGYAGMNFLDFFWMQGRPGIFWGVELGALASLIALLVLFRRDTQPVSTKVETEVTDYFPSALMIGTVALLIVASFLPEPEGGALLTVYSLRSGLVCIALCLIGIVRDCIRRRSGGTFLKVLKELDRDTLLLLFGLFMVIEGIKTAGVIDAAAELFYNVAGNNPFMLYTLIVFASVVLVGVHRQHSLCRDDAPGRGGHRGDDGRRALCVLLWPAQRRDARRKPHAHRRVGEHRRHRHPAQRTARPSSCAISCASACRLRSQPCWPAMSTSGSFGAFDAMR